MNHRRLPRLIATDLDNTLLRSDRTVSGRTVAALDAARAAGITVVPATARNPVGLHAVNHATRFADWALCGNGAYGIHLTSDEVLYSTQLQVSVLEDFTSAVSEREPDVRFAAVREAGRVFLAQDGYDAMATLSDHSRDPATMGAAALDDLTCAPALKLVFRHPTLPAPELFHRARASTRSLAPHLEMTMSGAPFVEVMASGVSKASGLEQLCSHLGIARRDVLAFGDGLNDTDMLAWAGHGVAVANAGQTVLACADQVTASNDDDGVAVVIEELLGLPAARAGSPR
ncbi:MAG: Cof-type HAD-IIB family hydrolase [Mycobacteriaceae bacterium]